MQQTKQLSGPEKFFDLSRNGPQEIILLILTTFCLDYNYIMILFGETTVLGLKGLSK